MANFQRTIEDFVCERCGAAVQGNGYTNHCPRCLCSKHVDVNPGDRAATCGGLMEPSAIEPRDGGYVVVHRCLACGHIRRNKTSPDDAFAKILEIVRRSAEGRTV